MMKRMVGWLLGICMTLGGGALAGDAEALPGARVLAELSGYWVTGAAARPGGGAVLAGCRPFEEGEGSSGAVLAAVGPEGVAWARRYAVAGTRNMPMLLGGLGDGRTLYGDRGLDGGVRLRLVDGQGEFVETAGLEALEANWWRLWTLADGVVMEGGVGERVWIERLDGRLGTRWRAEDGRFERLRAIDARGDGGETLVCGTYVVDLEAEGDGAYGGVVARLDAEGGVRWLTVGDLSARVSYRSVTGLEAGGALAVGWTGDGMDRGLAARFDGQGEAVWEKALAVEGLTRLARVERLGAGFVALGAREDFSGVFV